MAQRYQARLSNLVNQNDFDNPIIISGQLIYSHLRTRAQRTMYNNPNETYEAWLVGLGDPQITKGADTNLGKILANVGYTSRSFRQNNRQDTPYQTTWFIESRSRMGIPIVDGKTHQSMPGDQLLEHELATPQPVQVAISLHDTGKGNPALLLQAVMIEDANNIKYYEPTNNVANIFGQPQGQPLKKAEHPGEKAAAEGQNNNGQQSANNGFNQQQAAPQMPFNNQQPANNNGFNQQPAAPQMPFNNQQPAAPQMPFGNNAQQPANNGFNQPQGNPNGQTIDPNDINKMFDQN